MDLVAPLISSVPTPAQSVKTQASTATNYGDILRELQNEAKQQQQPPPRAEPFVADVPQQQQQQPVDVPQQQPVVVAQQQQPPPAAPADSKAGMVAAKWIPPAVAEKTDQVNKALNQESEGVLMRFRRHIFVAVVAFLVINYGTPIVSNLPFLSANAMFVSLALAAAIGILFYVGDVFLLMPETTVKDSR